MDLSRNATMSPFISGVRLPGLSAGIVSLICETNSSSFRSTHDWENVSPFSAGANPPPLKSSPWQAEHLSVFQRTANYVVPAQNHPLGAEEQLAHADTLPQRREALLNTLGGTFMPAFAGYAHMTNVVTPPAPPRSRACAGSPR